MSPTQSTDRLRNLLLLLTVTAALMGALLALFPAAGHDQLWFLMMARRWISGATLYGPQLFDSNPPAIIWASALPVGLGDSLHIPATFPAKFLVLIAEALTAWLCALLLRRSRPAFYDSGLLFAFVVLALVLPARDFGQRDQLLSFLILPYVLATALNCGTTLRCAAGLLAAIGICFKPQYALIPLALEVSLFISTSGAARFRQLLRPEPILIVITGAVYLTAIHHTAPLYFSQALPILRETYWAVGHLSIGELLLQAIELSILALAAIAIYFTIQPRSPIVRALLVAGAAAFFAYLLQGTGWYYQQIPALTLFGAALAVQILDLAARKPLSLPSWLVPSAAALCVLAVGLTMHFMGYPFTQDRSFAIEVPDPAFFRALPPGTPVAILTTSVDAAMMPMERYQLTWAQRTNNLWTLPAILRSESGSAHRLTPEQLSELESMQHRWMVEDLNHWRPQLILVQRCQDNPCQLLEDRHDDLLACFQRDPAFAVLWNSYRFERRSGAFDAYVLANGKER